MSVPARQGRSRLLSVRDERVLKRFILSGTCNTDCAPRARTRATRSLYRHYPARAEATRPRGNGQGPNLCPQDAAKSTTTGMGTAGPALDCLWLEMAMNSRRIGATTMREFKRLRVVLENQPDLSLSRVVKPTKKFGGGSLLVWMREP